MKTRRRSFYAMLLMCIAVSSVYLPIEPDNFPSNARSALLGVDFMNLHVRRLRYAQDALFGPQKYLPGWYTREFGGTPFWSNIHSFPFIPTRLPLLLIDPDRAYVVGVQLAALLAAVFTFLYCRRVGLGRVASAAGGWTFACSGFFASRVLAGQLPLLEAFPSLPLLLWLIEVRLESPPDDRHRVFTLPAAAAAACCVALAGHPQIPVYSFTIAVLYILWRARDRRGVMLLAAIVVGIGMASFSLYPTLRLIERSTRVLALGPSLNDVAFPYGRIAAFLFPWIHGMPPNFHGYPDPSYFWDTVCYVGWLPLVACVFLLARAVFLGIRPTGVWLFFPLVGILSLAFALPAWHNVMQQIPGTILRSPARQIYLTTFALAIGAGAALEIVLNYVHRKRWRWAVAVVALALVAHGWDLGYAHNRKFVVSVAIPEDVGGRDQAIFAQQVGPGRIGIDLAIWAPYNRQIDDMGFYDAITLAKPYRALQKVGGALPTLNVEFVDAAQLPPRALRFFGVSRVVTRRKRPDLIEMGDGVYKVPDAFARATLMPAYLAQNVGEEEIHRRLGQKDFDLANHLLLPMDAPKPQNGPSPTTPPSLAYEHPSTDEFVVRVNAPVAGYLLLLETWDPGWRATVDGAPAPLICAYDTFIAVPISPGAHEVRLTFFTPGARTGLVLSALCAILLAGLCWMQRRGPARS